MPHGRKIAVIGLGYVGLPVAVAFARGGVPVVGFDIDPARIEELRAGHDRSRELESSDLHHPTLALRERCGGARVLRLLHRHGADPDRRRAPAGSGAMLAASRTVAKALKPGDVVVYESTVYPGAVEEDCVPVLEQNSGLKAGKDFSVGYSPERINPGDKAHRFETIVKVVSGLDAKTLDLVAEVYGSVVKAGIHRAPSIKVAEAAKVIENSQRDLNIAFMNELSAICDVLRIDTGDVLAAARTKWNFLPFTPGLVGGHCIGVDPYYLTHRAEKAGYHPQVILAGRRINDSVGKRVALECVRSLFRRGTTRGDRHRARHDVQGKRAGHAQFQGRRHRRGAQGERHRGAGPRSAGAGRRDAARIRHRAHADGRAQARRRGDPRGGARALCARGLGAGAAAAARRGRAGVRRALDARSRDQAGRDRTVAAVSERTGAGDRRRRLHRLACGAPPA